MACRFLSRLPPVLIAILCAFSPLPAQKGATLSGRVRDRSTGNALPKAEIILLSDSRSVFADSLGDYIFRGLPGGVSGLLIRAPQFPALTIYVELLEGQELIRPVLLDSTPIGHAAQQLPAMAVIAEAPTQNYRLVDFEHRRRNGHGQYRDELELVKSGAYTLQDAVMPMRGVAVDCSKTTPSGLGCKIHMVRSPTNCQPEYVVDDRVDNMFGPTTPIRDIVGLEVYTGPSDVPGEFAGRNSGCGVIVIWTRSGPTQRKR